MVLPVAHQYENQVKAAVIDRLLSGSHVDSDAVLISEMTVGNWARRADVVLANGKLWAFEIKSNADSLARLPGQIEAFQKHFEKFTVVVAERFEKAIYDMVPNGVGIWIVNSHGEVTQKLAPRQKKLTKEAYISLMTAVELRKLIIASSLEAPKDARRYQLEAIAATLNLSDVANAARDAVKNRYRSRHQHFIKAQRHIGTIGAMEKLRRPKPPSAILETATLSCFLQEPNIPSDHPLLINAPCGPVLKRMVR